MSIRNQQLGKHRMPFERNRKKILASQYYCAICGKLVDKTLPPSDPMSATVDHIIPISKGGHMSDIDNLQLAHRVCNEKKHDFLTVEKGKGFSSNRDLPKSRNWKAYRSSGDEQE